MRNSLKGVSFTAWMVLGLLGGAGVAFASADRGEFVGEVIRVVPEAKRVVLKIPVSKSGEVEQMTVLVDSNTDLQGVSDLSGLKEGVPVKVEAKKNWFSREWTAKRLIYDPSQMGQRMSPTEKGQLNDIQNKFSQGRMGDTEYETKRQELAK